MRFFLYLLIVFFPILIFNTLLCQNQIKASWSICLKDSINPGDDLEMIIPFYESICIKKPYKAFREIGISNIELLYPSPISIPMIGWSYDHKNWNSVYASSLDCIPIRIIIGVDSNLIKIQLISYINVSFNEKKTSGDWQNLIESIRKEWEIKSVQIPLSNKYKIINFFTHRWISNDAKSEIKIDWSIGALKAFLKTFSQGSLNYIYGYDPNSIDLFGKYFWYKNSEEEVKEILNSNKKNEHLAWLNLRSYKFSIPDLNINKFPSKEMTRSARQYAEGLNIYSNYSYRAIEMCLASKSWQESRLLEFERLINYGFKVIQLDEFPIAPSWHQTLCRSKDHLHKPGDHVSEWQEIVRFIKILSQKAKKKNVLLTLEEPSAAFIPYVSGYIDRSYNTKPDIYGFWKKSSNVTLIPVFSTMFGKFVTPYTDILPDINVGINWLKMIKINSK